MTSDPPNRRDELQAQERAALTSDKEQSKQSGKQKPKAYVWVAFVVMLILIGLVFGFVFAVLPHLQMKGQ
jgi:hypothetical protein